MEQVVYHEMWQTYISASSIDEVLGVLAEKQNSSRGAPTLSWNWSAVYAGALIR